MTQFSVTFLVEADTLEAAEALVQGWTVTPGSMLVGIMGSVSSENLPIEVPQSGKVSEGESLAQAMAPAEPIADPAPVLEEDA